MSDVPWEVLLKRKFMTRKFLLLLTLLLIRVLQRNAGLANTHLALSLLP